MRRWWEQTDSNRQPSACRADALPAELCSHNLASWFEAATQTVCSSNSLLFGRGPRKRPVVDSTGIEPVSKKRINSFYLRDRWVIAFLYCGRLIHPRLTVVSHASYWWRKETMTLTSFPFLGGARYIPNL